MVRFSMVWDNTRCSASTQKRLLAVTNPSQKTNHGEFSDLGTGFLSAQSTLRRNTALGNSPGLSIRERRATWTTRPVRRRHER